MWKIVAGIIVGLIGVGGAAFGVDQQQKRKKEQASFRAQLQTLNARLSGKEAELAELCARLGEKNEQVRVLAEEVQHLRREIEGLEGAA